MPPVAIAAGIAAGGSIIGGVVSSKATSNAAKAQQQTAQSQIAAQQQNQQYVAGLEQPSIDRGNAAGSLIGNFYGLNGGDAAAQALATYRGSTGYNDLVNTGLGSVNANAYARGLGASGATLKALQAKGMALADQSSGQWLNGLNSLAQTGQAGINAVAGNATSTTNNIGQISQTGADAASNASLAQGATWNRTLQNLANAGSSFAGGSGSAGLGSSYAALAAPNNGQIGSVLPNGFLNFGRG